jgi:subtilisin family serine protease
VPHLLLLILFASIAMAVPSRALAQAVPPALSQKAQAEGTVRVIVHLAAPMTPEGKLTDGAAVHAQRQGIANAQNAVLAALAGSNHRVLHRYATLPYLVLEVDPPALAILNSLGRLITHVEEDTLSAPMLPESVPLVHGPAAWNTGFTGTGQVLAVLDTGIDKSHSFLTGKVIEEACYSGNGNCPNGQTSQTGPGAGVPCTYAPSACRHGTHVAGIAAGSGSSFSGVAKGASLMAVQVFSRFSGASCTGAGENPCALSFTSDQLMGLERVFALRNTYALASVNMSLGGGQSTSNCDGDPRKMAIDNLRSVGIATAIAAGNSGFTNALSAPGCISTAISVGSTDDGSNGTVADVISSFSNSASFLSLLAPGRWILSSIPGDAFANFAGTSMATPHVAGAWALLKQARPSATVDEVLTALQTTGIPITDSRNGLTKSRIRVFEALNALAATVADGLKSFTVTRCRLVDTRLAGGAIPANGFRSFLAAGALTGQGGAADCSVPAGLAKAVYISVVAVEPAGAGHLTVHQYPLPAPLASTLNFVARRTISNGVMVPICDTSTASCTADFTVTMGPAAANLVIDVTGYLAPRQ